MRVHHPAMIVGLLVASCGKGGDGNKPAAGAPATAPADVAKVLYRATADADVVDEQYRLFGITADGATAHVLRERRRDEPPLWALDSVELASGQRTASWETKAAREYVQLLPVDGTVEQAAVRFAQLAEATGPWSTRSATHWIEAQPVEGGMVYRTPSIFVADARGELRHEVGEASDLRVSPERRRLLLIEDVEAFARSRIIIADVGGTTPQFGIELGWLRAPMWSADGAAVYAVDAKGTDDREPCVVQLAATDVLAEGWRSCLTGTQPSLAQAPSGATLAFAIKTDRATTVRWIDATSGKERAIRTGLPALAPQLEDVRLDDHGRLVAISADWTSLIAIDLASGKVATLPAGDGGFWEGVRATRWLGDRIVVLRRRGATIELVEVDVAAMLSPG